MFSTPHSTANPLNSFQRLSSSRITQASQAPALDKIFREIAWKAVVEHPLSGVTDKNKNGIGDHLE